MDKNGDLKIFFTEQKSNTTDGQRNKRMEINMKCDIEYDDEFKELAETTLRKWGVDAQIKMMCEECAELTVVLLKQLRNLNPSRVPQVIEELVDVEIMLGQMKNIYGLNQDTWKIQKEDKLLRLQERLRGIE